MIHKCTTVYKHTHTQIIYDSFFWSHKQHLVKELQKQAMKPVTKRQFNHILHDKHIIMYYLQYYKSFISDCTFPIVFQQGNCSNQSQITVETGNPLFFLPNYPFAKKNSLLCTFHTFSSPHLVKMSKELSSVVVINPSFIHTSPFS